MDFKQVLNKSEDFLWLDLECQMISLIGLVFIIKKNYNINPGNRTLPRFGIP